MTLHWREPMRAFWRLRNWYPAASLRLDLRLRIPSSHALPSLRGGVRLLRVLEWTEALVSGKRAPVCPEHGLRPEVQTRDFCDVVDGFGPCGRFLVYDCGEPTRGRSEEPETDG